MGIWPSSDEPGCNDPVRPELEFTQVLSERMKSRDVDVDAAASGREALEKVRGNFYDALVLDL